MSPTCGWISGRRRRKPHKNGAMDRNSPAPGPATKRRQLARQLRELRLGAGLATMEQAAERSGLSRATISRIESAKQTILPRVVRLLCHSYGTGASTIDELLRLADKPYERSYPVASNDAPPDPVGRC